MHEDWYKTKFVSAKNIEGEPHTKQIEYAKKLFEKFGMEDPRFSGAVILGSTMKGYGLEDGRDIDVAIFSSEDRTLRATLFPQIYQNFYKFLKKFEHEQGETPAFDIDSRPGITYLSDYFNTTGDKIEINPKYFSEKINFMQRLGISKIIFKLCYPIIETKNSEAPIPIGKVVNSIKEAILKLTTQQKIQLLESIIQVGTRHFREDFTKHSARTKDIATKEQYVDARVATLKQKLKNKFGLTI